MRANPTIFGSLSETLNSRKKKGGIGVKAEEGQKGGRSIFRGLFFPAEKFVITPLKTPRKKKATRRKEGFVRGNCIGHEGECLHFGQTETDRFKKKKTSLRKSLA